MTEVYVGAGSNIEPEQHLRAAVVSLAATFGVLRLSPVYRSAPVGVAGDDFLNMVIGFDSDMAMADVVGELADIEARHGRDRSSERRYGPRTLDLDLLLFGDRVATEGGVSVPRDDILEHAFVLRPLADLAADRRHPGVGRTIGELWAGFDAGGQTLEPIELKLVEV
jgi:2-amino-4-hydroxy-6-hydroxymethyldihydropteridine diphosphokinase